MRRFLLALALTWPGLAFGQATLQQGGSTTTGHVPMYQATGSQQPIVLDSGPAGGTTRGQGLSELNITARCTTPPCAAGGTGPDGTIFTINDAVSNNATGGHTLSFSANALGGGLIEYGAFGSATALPFNIRVNGTSYAFPFVSGGIVGPGTTTVGHIAVWNNTSGTLLADGGVALAMGGSNGQTLYNNAGAIGGYTMGGDATIVASTGALTINQIQGHAVTIGASITTGGTVNFANNFTTVGGNSLTLTVPAPTNVTLPASGTRATLAASEAFTNKTYNGLTLNATTGTFALTNGKTLTVSNTLQLTGTDGSTLNMGTGGTLGTAAYTAATAYIPSNTQVTNALSGDVNLNNTANYFAGPTVAQGSTGTWFCSGRVTVLDTGGSSQFYAKLWDGTTVIASGAGNSAGANGTVSISLSGYLATPAGNVRIDARDSGAVTGVLKFNASGNSKDSSVSCFRVN